MNSDRKQEPPSTLSLLDLIREALFRQGKSELVQRVVYVARVEPGHPMRKDLQNKGIPESAITTTVTGICLVYNQTIVHLIEASPELIMAHLRDITTAPQEKRFMENVPSNVFPFWMLRNLSGGRNVSDEEIKVLQDPVGTAAECSLNLQQLGKKLGALESQKLEEALDALKLKFRDLIPTNEILLSLVTNGDTFDAEDYLELYDKPTEVTLEKDTAWPITL